MELGLLIILINGVIYRYTSTVDLELSSICFIIGFLWVPNLNLMKTDHYYSYIDDENENNPLFVRGILRKRNSLIFAKIRSLYFCQVLSVFLLAFSYVYLYFCRTNGYQNLFIKWFLIIVMSVIGLIWCWKKMYYTKIYRDDFKYAENEEGIWMPFRYITEYPRSTNYKQFHCRYHVGYENLKERLKKVAVENEYNLVEEYDEKERESLYFIKKSENKIRILNLIHIKKYMDKDLDYFNSMFEAFYKKSLHNINTEVSVDFMFLLCVDEETRQLRKKFLDACCVYHKKGRHRLPIVLVYGEHDNLDIVANNTEGKCASDYRDMRREMMKMLDIGLSDKDQDVYFDEEGKRIDETWLK